MNEAPDRREEARVRACIDDDDALAELYRAHGAEVRSFLLRTLPRSALEDADDLCQEVFLQVPKAARGYRGDAAPRSWLFGIAARVARSRARRFAVRRMLLLERAPPEPESPTHEPDLRIDLERSMDALSLSHREVLVLTVVEGLSAEEAAAVLGVRPKTVWTRLHRARAALREALEGDEGPP